MIKLYDYQEEYMSHTKPNWIYDCDTGTGKTIMALEHHRRYFPDCPILIVAPASKIDEGGWQRTIAEHYSHIEYETLTFNSMPRKYKNYAGYFVIIDEAHRIKNSTKPWGRSAYALTGIAKGFVLLSATLIPEGWEDAINYFKMFGLTKNKTQFLKRNAIMETEETYGGNTYNVIVGWRNETKLSKLWKGISRRLNKEDANDLPPIVFENIYFKPSALYRKIKKDRVVGTKLYDNQMSLRHGLRLNTNIAEKVKYLHEWLKDINDNVIIFYNYDEEYELLKYISNKTTYSCNGHVKDYPKKEDWSNVRNSVTIANYKTGSEAVEFTYGRIIIYFSPCEGFTDFYQSYGRVHRQGATEKITAYKFITKGTIEEDIYNSLDNKTDFNYSQWEANNL